MLTKIISGGQTGADQGGLEGAVAAGYETGGWIPKGWLTENGSQPDLAKFGLIEHTSNKYPPRTYANVRDSDATIRIAFNLDTAGEQCTLKAINQYGKIHLDVSIQREEHGFLTDIPPIEVAEWLIKNDVNVCNIAGNRESTFPGLQQFVAEFIKEVLYEYVKYPNGKND